MDFFDVAKTIRVDRHGATSVAEGGVRLAWAFVYVFFTNGIPFDSPNRSEPCTHL